VVENVVQVGQEVQVRVIDVTPAGLALAMDATAADFVGVPENSSLKAVVVGRLKGGSKLVVAVWPPGANRSKEGIATMAPGRSTRGQIPGRLSRGQEVRVCVTDVDLAADQVHLTLGGGSSGDAVVNNDSLTPGMELNGTVASLTGFGFYVDVGAERLGLVAFHRAGAGFVTKVDDIVRVGEKVQVRVATSSPRELLLAMDSTAEAFVDVSPFDVLRGTVVGLRDFSARVAVWPPGGGRSKDGFLRFRMQPPDTVAVGREVRVRVKSVNVTSDKLILALADAGSPRKAAGAAAKELQADGAADEPPSAGGPGSSASPSPGRATRPVWV